MRVLTFAPMPFVANGRRTFDGGLTVFYESLLPRLAGLGHEVTVIADAPAATPGERRASLAWNVAGLVVDGFVYEHRSSQVPPTSAYRRETSARIRAAFERQLGHARPDVVLIGREVVTLYALELCEQARVPTLVVAHGPTADALAARRYPPELHDELCARLARVDRVVAVAEHVAASLRSVGLTRVSTIPNVVDADRFRPAPKDARLAARLGIAADDVVVAHVSLLRPWKRPADLVDSAARVVAAEPRCLYLVVGTGPCRAEMEERVRGAGIAARFRWTNAVPHDEVPAYLNLADVVVHPSEREGFPLVYREAQACGRALLVSDIAPAREAIDPDRTGVVFPLGDVGALAEATLALVRDPERRGRLGAAARDVVAGTSVDAWAGAYEAALAAACEEHRTRSGSA